MRRGALLLGLLAVVALVGFLLYSMDDSGTDRSRRGAGATRPGSGEGESSSGDAGAESENALTPGSELAVDDDPNRVDGPELVVKGIVLWRGRPAAGAEVSLRRAAPTDPRLLQIWNTQRRTTRNAVPVIAVTQADDDGRFELRAPRRSLVTVTARADGSGPASVRLYVPREKNPADVKIELPDGHELGGIVVDAKGSPLAGARVLCNAGGWQTAPIVEEAETGADGRFSFPGLAAGYHTVTVQLAGYPEYFQSVNVPQAREIEMRLYRGGRLRGVARDDRGQPIGGAELSVTFASRGLVLGARANVVTAADGSYVIEDAPASTITYAVFNQEDWGQRTSAGGDFRLPLEAIDEGGELVWDLELAVGSAVRGRIVVRGTGEPVPLADLTLMKVAQGGRSLSDSRYGKADAEGRFELLHVEEGSYAVRVISERHARPIKQWVQPNERLQPDFHVDGRNSPPEVRIEVEGAGRIEGRMLGEAPSSWDRTNVQLDNGVTYAQIDETGFFVFDGVVAGDDHQLKCWNPQCESEPFTVRAGEITEVELNGDARAQFTGVVIGSNGEPVRGAYVRACPESQIQQQLKSILQQGGWGSSRTDGEGRFSIYVPPWQSQQASSQEWAIAAVSYEYPLQVVTDLRLPADTESTEVRIVLEAGGVISGLVEFEGRGPLAGVAVRVNPQKEAGNQAASDARQSRYTYTDLQGRFSVEGIGEGTWSVTTAHADGQAKPVQAVAGDDAIRLVLKPTLALSGVVLDEDDDPVRNARVGAVVSGGPKEDIRWTQTDGAGRFRISHLEAGDYPIEVSPQANQQNLYYGGAQQVTGGFQKTRTRAYPAGTEGIVVKVEPGPRIKGRVTDAQGRGVSGAGVMGIPLTKGLKIQPTAFTSGRGDFTLKGLEDGEYEIVVIASGYLIETANASVGQTGLQIQVQEGGTIEGIVLLPDGKPASGVWMQFTASDPEVQKKLQDWQRRGNIGWNNLGGWQKSATSTGTDGSFRITGLFPGKHRLWLSTKGGVAPSTEFHTDGGKVTIRLQPALTVSGLLVTETGDVPTLQQGQFWVSITRADGMHGGSSQVGSKGEFNVEGLPAGELKMSVWGGNEYEPVQTTVTAGDQNVRIVMKKRQPPQPKPAPAK